MSFERNIAKLGFTLAELLVMILILATVFSILLPAVTALTGRGKLDAAADQIHAALKLARQHAVAQKQPTYLVLDPAHRAYSVYSINIHHPPVDARDGVLVQDWNSLPAGIVFDADIDRRNNIFDAARGPWMGALTRNNRLLIEGNAYVTFGFKPNGTAASATRHIHLTEGVEAHGGILPSRDATGKRVRVTTLGKSLIQDYRPAEDGGIDLLGARP